MITDEIMKRAQAKVSNRQLSDVRFLAEMGEKNGAFAPAALLQNVPTTDWRDLLGYRTGKSILEMVPDRPGGFLGLGEGNFAGVSRSRETTAKRMLSAHDRECVISQWEPYIRCKLFDREFTILKEDIATFEFVNASSEELQALAVQQSE